MNIRCSTFHSTPNRRLLEEKLCAGGALFLILCIDKLFFCFELDGWWGVKTFRVFAERFRIKVINNCISVIFSIQMLPSNILSLNVWEICHSHVPWKFEQWAHKMCRCQEKRMIKGRVWVFVIYLRINGMKSWKFC